MVNFICDRVALYHTATSFISRLFRNALRFSLLAVAKDLLCVCLYVCVCVHVYLNSTIMEKKFSSLTLTFVFKVKFYILFYFPISRKWWETTYYYRRQIGNHIFALEWSLRMLYNVIVIYSFNATKYEMLISGKRWELPINYYDFYRRSCSPSNGIIAYVLILWH